MLTAKDIIEMEESTIHPSEPRKRSDTLHEDQMSSNSSSTDWNPALVSRRASVPMEIIIGGDGKPIFTASSNSNVGSPVLPERLPKNGRSGSKKRNGSMKKKTTGNKKQEKQSPDSLLINSMATCSIGSAASAPKQKNIDCQPEYELFRPERKVTVRDAVIQTDLF